MIEPGDIVYRKRVGGTIQNLDLLDKSQIGLVLQVLRDKGCIPQCRVMLGEKKLWFYNHDLQRIEKKE